MELHFEQGSILIRLLQADDLLRRLVEHHSRYERVVLHEQGELFEAVLAGVERLERMVESLTVLEQLHFLAFAFGHQENPPCLNQFLLEVDFVALNYPRLWLR